MFIIDKTKLFSNYLMAVTLFSDTEQYQRIVTATKETFVIDKTKLFSNYFFYGYDLPFLAL